MAAFLYRLAGSPSYKPSADDKAYFSDVDETTPHANEIWWLASKGISKGWEEADGTHTFRPDDNITRDSMAIMFHRAAGSPTVTQAQMNAVTFKDISGCSANVKKAIAWAVSAGIVKGFSKERYGPLENSTRLQVAIMLYRFYK